MGLIIALSIFILWITNLYYSLSYSEPGIVSFSMYLHMLLQAYLYTGLFITAHDAMHGTVSRNRKLNDLTGQISLFLFAGMSFRYLRKNHFKHHANPGETDDPDFNTNTQNFFKWWISFLLEYLTWKQLLIMAVLFNIFKVWFNESYLIIYWVIPAFISTLQLFYFGTYLPHRYPHKNEMLPHNSRSQKKNHLWAMLSCYFFGYHFEHHESPRTPWWRLYKLKN